MSRFSLFLLCTAAALSALAAYWISQETQSTEAELRRLQRDIVLEQEAIHVARADWSYLTRPARIADIAKRRLDYQELTAARFIKSGDLGPRRDLLLAEYNHAFTIQDPGP